MKNNVSNVRYEQVNSIKKNCKEFRVRFLLNNKEETYTIYVKEGNKVNYLNEAKKIFEADVKSGTLTKTTKLMHRLAHPALITGIAALGVAVIALSGVAVYRTLHSSPTEYIDNPTRIVTTVREKDGGPSYKKVEFIDYDDSWYPIRKFNTMYTDEDNAYPAPITEITCTRDEKHRIVQQITKSMNPRKTISTKNPDVYITSVMNTTYESDDKWTRVTENFSFVGEKQVKTEKYENITTDAGSKKYREIKTVRYADEEATEIQTLRVQTSEEVYDKLHRPVSGVSNEQDFLDPQAETPTHEYKSTINYKYENDTSINHTYTVIDKLYYEGTLDDEYSTKVTREYSNKNSLTRAEEYKYDGEFATLTGGSKTDYQYDNLNRRILMLKYNLVMSGSTTNDWELASFTTDSYLGDNRDPTYEYTEKTDTDLLENATTIRNTTSTYYEYDQYGRLIRKEERQHNSISNATTPDATITEYTYGDPVPVEPGRKQDTTIL